MSDIPGISTRVDYVGPFENVCEVVVNGWSVPFLQAHPHDEDKVMLSCDHRLAATFTLEEAERFVPFLADCIAVALGYGSHPTEDGELVPLPHCSPRRVHRIGEISSRPPEETGQ